MSYRKYDKIVHVMLKESFLIHRYTLSDLATAMRNAARAVFNSSVYLDCWAHVNALVQKQATREELDDFHLVQLAWSEAVFKKVGTLFVYLYKKRRQNNDLLPEVPRHPVRLCKVVRRSSTREAVNKQSPGGI